MKNAFLFLSLLSLVTACGGETEKAKTQESYTLADQTQPAADSTTGANLSAVARQPQIDTNATKIGTSPTGGAVAAGAKLMASADCASCHRDNEKLLGPAYKDIASKYSATDANVQMLTQKIITGGKGNWGDIAMTPHPGLAEKDAAEMVRYILTLK